VVDGASWWQPGPRKEHWDETDRFAGSADSGVCGRSCAAQEVAYNFDRDADFSKFFSYKWVDIKSEQQVDRLTAQQIIIVIDNELAKKRPVQTDSDYADLYIGYQTALSRQTLWMAYRDGWGYGPRWGGGLASIAEASVHARELDLAYMRQPKKTGVARRRIECVRSGSKSR